MSEENISIAAFVPEHQVRDGLPRDAAGRVIGEWHVSVTPSEMFDGRIDTRLMGDVIEGDAVDRAVALGCEAAPGRRRPKRKPAPSKAPKTPAVPKTSREAAAAELERVGHPRELDNKVESPRTAMLAQSEAASPATSERH